MTTKKGNILIADDIELNRLQLIKIVNNKYNCIEAKNGIEVFNIIDSGVQIDCLLLDLLMPDMDGYEVLKKLHSNKYNDIPVIVITANQDTENEERVLALGAYDFFYKPFVPNILLLKIDNSIKNNQIINLKAYKKRIELDSLTKLYMKDVFYIEAQKYIDEHPNEKLSLVVTDIKNFTQINTIFGSKKADEILISEANILKNKCDKFGLPYGRFENDSFCFIVPDNEQTYENFTHAFKPQSFDNVINYKIHILFGVYRITELIPVDRMCQYALSACKRNNHKDMNVSFFDDSLFEMIKVEDEISENMEASLKKGEFVVYYQPIMALNSKKAVSCEALVRWNYKSKGLLQPNMFIPIFEKNGFIIDLDRYVWETVCQDLRQAIDNNISNLLPISINISRVDFFNENLVEELNALLKKYDLPHKLIRIEITESAFQDNIEAIINLSKKFKDNGYKILMDDFGTGYSSLESLEDIPVDILKLDMRFMKNLGVNSKTAVIVSSILRMCKLLDLEVVAEGIETNEQLDFLKSIGCEYGQGYLYSKPLPVKEFHNYVLNKRINNDERQKIEKREFNLKAIWDAETNFSSLFNNMITPMGVYEYNQNDGLSLVRVNNSYLTFVGGTYPSKYPDPNIPFKNDYLLNKKDYDSLLKYAKETKEISSAILNRKKYDGEEYKALVKVKYLGNISNRDDYLFTLSDVSIQEKLIHDNEALLDNTPGFVCKYYYHYKTNEFKLLLVKGQVEQILGYSPIEFKDKIESKDNVIVYSEDRNISSKALTELVKFGKTNPNTLRYVTKKGNIIWITMYFSLSYKNDDYIEFYTNSIDTTIEHENSLKLMKINEKYRILVHGLCVITFDYNVDSDTLVFEASDDKFSIKKFEIEDYLKNIPISNSIHDISKAEYISNIKLAINSKFKGKFKYLSNIFGDGYKWLLTTYQSIVDPDGLVHHILGRVDDIDALQKQNDALIEEANEDYLTGLYNRKYFENTLNTKYQSLNNCLLLFIDFDNFKIFNDNYGHDVGDRVLKKFGIVVKELLGYNNILCRFGGDEFVFVLRTINDLNQVSDLMNKIIIKLNDELKGTIKEQLSISYGTEIIDTNLSISELLKNVDKKMYQNKKKQYKY